MLVGSFCKANQFSRDPQYMLPNALLTRTADAYPEFLRRFGVDNGTGDIQIPAPWQAALGNGGAVGQIVGLLVRRLYPTPLYMLCRLMICRSMV